MSPTTHTFPFCFISEDTAAGDGVTPETPGGRVNNEGSSPLPWLSGAGALTLGRTGTLVISPPTAQSDLPQPGDGWTRTRHGSGGRESTGGVRGQYRLCPQS